MKCFKCIIFVFCSFFCFNLALWAQTSDFEKGEDLFARNKPEEAVVFLKSALAKKENPKVYEYLSLSYFQMGMLDEGLDIVSEGIKVSGTDKKLLALNAGNACYVAGRYSEAEIWYSLSLTANANYTSSLLNRANARVNMGKFAEAKEDYLKFLSLCPNDARRPSIEALLAALDEEIAMEAALEAERQAEAERIAEEEARIQEELRLAEEAKRAELERQKREMELEQQRLAEEKARLEAEEAERKRRLLEEVAASLQDNETTNMTAGAGDIIDYGYETELE